MQELLQANFALWIFWPLSVVSGFAGALYPVNASGEEVQGLPSFCSVSEIPGAVDLAIVSVPAPVVLPALRDCRAKGVRCRSLKPIREICCCNRSNSHSGRCEFRRLCARRRWQRTRGLRWGCAFALPWGAIRGDRRDGES